MSLVMPVIPPPATRYGVSRSSTPRGGSPTPPSSARLHSRPATPPPGAATVPSSAHLHLQNALHTISAPPTPVNTTHLVPLPSVSPLPAALGMERCRSSEAVLSHSHSHTHTHAHTQANGTASADATPRKPHPLSGQPPTQEVTPPVELPPSADVSPLDSPEPVHEEHVEAAAEQPHTEDAHPDYDRMDIDDVEVPIPELGLPTSDDSVIWGMPKWGLEDERPEVRPGVRLVGMEELPGLLERHSMLDTPSQVMFPWLHGISDDGAKGREMGAFFGYGPPFEPPPFRGLTMILAPPHPLDRAPLATSPVAAVSSPLPVDPIQRPEDTPSNPGSYQSAETSTSPTTTAESIGPITPASTTRKLSDSRDAVQEVGSDTTSEADVQMHPCESKRVAVPAVPDVLADTGSDSDSDSFVSEDDPGPSCILLNAVHAQDVFELPMFPSPGRRPSYARSMSSGSDNRPAGRFRAARLPNQINLRNLHIQQIKYSSVSDIIVYTRNGVGPGVLEVAEAIAQAQDHLYKQRMDEFYCHCMGRGEGEGLDRPVKYGVWVLVEPFTKVERFCPHLVNIDSEGRQTENSRLVDLFEREAYESRAMTRATEVLEGFWVGNDTDVPGGADDGAGAHVPFDLCVKASECSDMPTSNALAYAYRSLVSLDRHRTDHTSSWAASPATVALRNLLSPNGPPTPVATPGSAIPPEPRATELGTSPDESHIYAQQHAAEHHYVALECAGSCRTITGQMRNLATMTDKVIELVSFLRKIIEARDKTGIKRLVLVHCLDGYTESSILVLSYIMASLGVSLPEAYLHFQLVAKRSFFLYPTDKPLLHRIEARLAQERRERALKCVRSSERASQGQTSPTGGASRWKPWGFIRGGSPAEEKKAPEHEEPASTKGQLRQVDVARRVLVDDGRGGSQAALSARVWFEDKRFDGFPSRILPFLYLGNLEHAGNAAMLKALNITHVVSVGESLLDVPHEHDPLHGYIGSNTLAAEARLGRIQVLDLTDVRDDGNDPLRPVIARATEWMEQARITSGSVLVHCRVGVSRSASIVMAYLMKYRGMGLMDAYLVTRARRLNVLIQPNLRFFHELFGWEVELARAEAAEREQRRQEAIKAGVRDPSALALLDTEPAPRRILYTWPTFCRDVHCLNRRFLCN